VARKLCRGLSPSIPELAEDPPSTPFAKYRGSLCARLRDDDFAKLVTGSVHADTNVLILADCCHSGTVADLNKPLWQGYRVASISGCTDKQTSGLSVVDFSPQLRVFMWALPNTPTTNEPQRFYKNWAPRETQLSELDF
jgi:hypothetical protein